MAVKTPYGYGRQSKDILELSEGVSPTGSIRLAPWIPITERNQASEFDIAIKAGNVIAIEYITTAVGSIATGPYYVPANGGKATTLAYTSLDVGLTLNKNTGAVVTAAEVAAASTATHPANNPVGYNFFDFYHDQENAYNNMQIQTYEKAIVTRYFIEVPVKYEYQLGSPGELIMADWAVPGSWRPVDANYHTTVGSFTRYTAGSGVVTVDEQTNKETQIIGRLLFVQPITDIDNLSMVTTMPGLSLTGSGSNGVPTHLRNAATISGVEYRARILVNA